jgi:predicted metal-dependent peptidase
MTKTDPVQRVLARLILRYPFLATLALRLERTEDPTTDTAWTDGVQLAVNPAWFERLDDEEREALVAHECYHVALAHHLRRAGREKARWNRACDYAVNALLVEDGFRLPEGALHDPAFGDASAEAIYSRLPPQEDTPRDGAGSSPPGGTASRGPTSPAPADPTSPGAGGFGEVRDQPFPAPPTPAEQEARLAEHAVLITALAQQARAAGKDSGGARRAATLAAQPPAVDWRSLLAEFLVARHTQDYSWRRPNLRYALLGLYIPVLEAAAPGKIAFVVDTSGSVPDAALKAVTSELEAYLQQYPATTLDLVYADAKVTGRASYTASDLPLRLEPIGGGGTDFRPALAELADDDLPPACAVYLTDLEGRFPDEPPPTPVIWLVFGQPLTPPTAPFGRVVLLPY